MGGGGGGGGGRLLSRDQWQSDLVHAVLFTALHPATEVPGEYILHTECVCVWGGSIRTSSVELQLGYAYTWREGVHHMHTTEIMKLVAMFPVSASTALLVELFFLLVCCDLLDLDGKVRTPALSPSWGWVGWKEVVLAAVFFSSLGAKRVQITSVSTTKENKITTHDLRSPDCWSPVYTTPLIWIRIQIRIHFMCKQVNPYPDKKHAIAMNIAMAMA